MPLLGPAGPAGSRRRGRRRGLVVGAAVGSAAARRQTNTNEPQPPEPVAAQTDTNNEMDELEKLGRLKDEGILTQEEFDAKKKQILGL